MSNPPSLVIFHAHICKNIGITSKLKMDWPTSFSPLQSYKQHCVVYEQQSESITNKS
jgi:hypothetical protein